MFIYAAIQMIDAQRGKKQFDNYQRLREKLCALCNEFGRSRNVILHIHIYKADTIYHRFNIHYDLRRDFLWQT